MVMQTMLKDGQHRELLKQAANMERLRLSDLINKKMRHYEQVQLDINNILAVELLTTAREILNECNNLNTLISHKDKHYAEKVSAINLVLTSLDNVIDRAQDLREYNTADRAQALEQSIQQFEASGDNLDKKCGYHLGQKVLGLFCYFGGLVAMIINIAHANFFGTVLSMVSVGFGIGLLGSSDEEKKSLHINRNISKLTGTVNNLFKPALNTMTHLSTPVAPGIEQQAPAYDYVHYPTIS